MYFPKPSISRILFTSGIFLSLVATGIAQRETAKEHKAADQPQADQKSQPEKTENQGDPQFKGMKYRLIGPFRGGRSLTAAGIPGDPNTYYFGSTGGGV